MHCSSIRLKGKHGHRIISPSRLLSHVSRGDKFPAENITWVDISAPGDGCAFALSDPVSVSGVAPPQGQRWPLILSAAFSQTLSPEMQKSLRHRYFRLHFQYLCAFDQPGLYDYFKITAGPMTLADRYRGRRPSAKRIDVPASRFTSTVR